MDSGLELRWCYFLQFLDNCTEAVLKPDVTTLVQGSCNQSYILNKKSLDQPGDSTLKVLHSKVLVQPLNFHSVDKECPCSMNEKIRSLKKDFPVQHREYGISWWIQ